jgi:hypothetical protein
MLFFKEREEKMNYEKNSNPNFSDEIGVERKYWGEIDQKTMNHVIEQAKRNGYLEALIELVRARPDLADYLLNDRRVDWIFHCLRDYASHPTRVLDVGSGWGALSFLMSNYFDEVWSAEATYERAVFQSIRKEQTKDNKIHIVRSWSHKLPFSNEFFDLAVVNGLFEWIAFGDDAKNPEKLQLEFLKNTYKMLKVGGCLYLGIENRIGYPYFLGAPDHSDLPFTSLLPRPLASFFVTLAGGYQNRTTALKKYSTYTYSALGYRKLLALAGFTDISIYSCTDYNLPIASWKITDDKALNHFLKIGNSDKAKFLKFPKIMNKAANFLFQNFLIFAYKGYKPETFEDKMCKLYEGKGIQSFVRLSGNIDTAYHFLDKKGRPTHVVRVPRFKSKQQNFEKKEQLMAYFNKFPLQSDYFYSGIAFIEKYIEGSKFEILNPLQNSDALNWLFSFQKRYSKGSIAEEEIHSEIELLLNYAKMQKINNIQRIKKNLTRMNNSASICVPEHGDFWAGNILFNGAKISVLDWEEYRERGNYFFDPFFFLIANSFNDSLCTEGPDGSVSSFCRNWTGAGPYSHILKNSILEFRKNYNLDPESIINAVPYVIIKKIARSDPKINGWNPHFIIFPKLLEAWYKYENEILNYLSL